MPRIFGMSEVKVPEIDPEFAKLLPVRTPLESADLERQIIQASGATSPLVVWKETNLIVGGHNRFRICKAHTLPYTVTYMSFADRQAAEDWMIDDQLAQRNLTDQERQYFMGTKYNREKEKQGGQMPKGSDTMSHPSKVPATTAKKIAKKYKTSDRTVLRAGKFADAVDAHEATTPGAKSKILSGQAGRGFSKVVKTAPTLCARCLRVGRVKDCPECVKESAKKKGKKPGKKPVPTTLFPDKRTPAEKKQDAEEDPFEKLGRLGTSFSALCTKLMNDHGDRNKRLYDYLVMNGLVDHPPGETPVFLPWKGVRAIIEMTGLRVVLDSKAVKDGYLRACGALPYVPPATKFRRENAGRS